MTFASASADETEEGRAFLQRRVAMAGLAGALGFGGFLVYRFVLGFLGAHDAPFEPSMLWHGAAALAFVAVWLVCRRGELSAGFVRVVEATGLLSATMALAVMGQYIPLWNRPEMIVLSALSFGWSARAVYVPSTARRTFVLTSLAGVPQIAGAYVSSRAYDPARWSAFDASFADLDARAIGILMGTNVGMWWLLTVGLCTAASRVIYGLRREVRQARQLGQYTLEEKIGEGGMGAVYRARHAMLRRPTAIKLLLPERAGADNLARFEREVQLTAELTHPNTIRIHDYGRTPDGTLYYAMELLAGVNLERLVELDGPQDPARVVHIVEQIASALVEAHGAGLIHRDIKPSNILLCQQGGLPDITKLLDFGLVKNIEGDGQEPGLTNPEVVTGTPLYMAPESITAPESVDARADLYALGAVAYFLLTGTHVFEAKTLVEVCSHHLHTPPEPPGQRLGKPLPCDLSELVLSCLAKKREARPASAAELLSRLRGCDSHSRWDDAAARAWWQTTGEQIQAASAPGRAGEGDARTELRIDLADRAP